MLLFALFATVGFALILAPPVVPCIAYLTGSIASLSAAIIHLAGGHVQVVDHTTLRAPDTGFSMTIVYGCNGINVVVLLWSALLAWPPAAGSTNSRGWFSGRW